jgi:hypothetical protein
MTKYVPRFTREQRAERRKQMAMEVKSGKTPQKVAEKFGVIPQTVIKACHFHRVEYPVASAFSSGSSIAIKTYDVMREIIEGKMIDARIAEKFEITRSRVNQIRERMEGRGILKAVENRIKAGK